MRHVLTVTISITVGITATILTQRYIPAFLWYVFTSDARER